MLARLTIPRARSLAASMAHQNGTSHAAHNLVKPFAPIPAASYQSAPLAIAAQDDDETICRKYRPFLHDNRHVSKNDWVAKLELSTIESLVAANLEATQGNRLKVLVLYGSLRSRYVAYVACFGPV